MESIRNLYKIGHGPSSSHTMAPQKAAQMFKNENEYATSFRVTLYGSLAATGKGHMTDIAIINTLLPYPTKIVWEPETVLPFHTNGMKFEAIVKDESVKEWIVYSIGGGDLSDGKSKVDKQTLYDKNTMKDILEWCQRTGKTFWEYVEDTEGKEIYDYLLEVWKTMEAAIHRGIDAEGLLPGGLGLQRKASMSSIKAKGYQGSMKSRALIYSYALAVSEENASGKLWLKCWKCLSKLFHRLNRSGLLRKSFL